MSGSEPRLWSKERKNIRTLTGDRTIESAKDLDRWQKKTGRVVATKDEADRMVKHYPDLTEREAKTMVDEYREETYGRLPDGERIKELHGDRVLVEMQEIVLSKFLIIPDKVKGRPRQGVVRMTGPGKLTRDGSKVIPMEVKPGDTVVVLEFSGIDVGWDKRLCEEDEILAVVK